MIAMRSAVLGLVHVVGRHVKIVIASRHCPEALGGSLQIEKARVCGSRTERGSVEEEHARRMRRTRAISSSRVSCRLENVGHPAHRGDPKRSDLSRHLPRAFRDDGAGNAVQPRVWKRGGLGREGTCECGLEKRRPMLRRHGRP